MGTSSFGKRLPGIYSQWMRLGDTEADYTKECFFKQGRGIVDFGFSTGGKRWRETNPVGAAFAFFEV
jgi:hypothetical protein